MEECPKSALAGFGRCLGACRTGREENPCETSNVESQESCVQPRLSETPPARPLLRCSPLLCRRNKDNDYGQEYGGERARSRQQIPAIHAQTPTNSLHVLGPDETFGGRVRTHFGLQIVSRRVRYANGPSAGGEETNRLRGRLQREAARGFVFSRLTRRRLRPFNLRCIRLSRQGPTLASFLKRTDSLP